MPGTTTKPLSREQDIEQSAQDYHDHNLTNLDSINQTLFATIDAMEEHHIPYALIGGMAVKSLGRPRVTHDIDIFVHPDDAEGVLDTLKTKGFHTELRDPFWLYKAWRGNVLVDVIFKSSGDIYFDEEVREHVRRIPYMGKYFNAISPEDFIVIKAAVHQEHIPHHWHDALAVLTQGDLDWDYLIKRARHSPRRVLALLIYGQSNDIAIPNEIINRLHRMIYEPPQLASRIISHPYRQDQARISQPNAEASYSESPIYTKAKIIEALTGDERIAEHDIKVFVAESAVIAKGEVFTEEQRSAVTEVINKIAPNCEIKNLVNVRVLSAPDASEAIQ